MESLTSAVAWHHLGRPETAWGWAASKPRQGRSTKKGGEEVERNHCQACVFCFRAEMARRLQLIPQGVRLSLDRVGAVSEEPVSSSAEILGAAQDFGPVELMFRQTSYLQVGRVGFGPLCLCFMHLAELLCGFVQYEEKLLNFNKQ